jgi:hypothetical protein
MNVRREPPRNADATDAQRLGAWIVDDCAGSVGATDGADEAYRDVLAAVPAQSSTNRAPSRGRRSARLPERREKGQPSVLRNA